MNKLYAAAPHAAPDPHSTNSGDPRSDSYYRGGVLGIEAIRETNLVAIVVRRDTKLQVVGHVQCNRE
jgi:hypothetical protein